MLTQIIGVIWYGNCHSVVDSYSNINLIVKLIRETDVFKI